jgi:hypothetical protein
MRASKVGLLGLAIAAAFAAGAMAAPPHNNATESSQPHAVAAVVLSPGATRNVVDIQRDIRAIIEPTISDPAAVLATLEKLGDFVVSYKRGEVNGQLPALTREEMLDMKPGVVLDDVGVHEGSRQAVLALVNEWIDIRPAVDPRVQVQP